jgi:hypothetical protein
MSDFFWGTKQLTVSAIIFSDKIAAGAGATK